MPDTAHPTSPQGNPARSRAAQGFWAQEFDLSARAARTAALGRELDS